MPINALDSQFYFFNVLPSGLNKWDWICNRVEIQKAK